jgi:hypothetical protein
MAALDAAPAISEAARKTRVMVDRLLGMAAILRRHGPQRQ